MGNMGMDLTRFFWLLVCCELSTLAFPSLGNNLTFRNGGNTREDTKAFLVRTGTEEPTVHRRNWELNGVGSADTRRGTTPTKLPNHETFKQNKTYGSDSLLDWKQNFSRKLSLYAQQRPKRAALDKTGSFLTPAAQNQPKLEPTGLPTEHGTPFPEPEEDYEDITPFGPVNTRPKGPALPNPFYPLGGAAYAAYITVLLSFILFSAGIITNIAIMCTVCNNYYMRSVSNSLLASMALWDFLIIFFCLPLVVFHQFTKVWLLGEFSCKIIPYIEVTSLGITTFTLCALCIDRFRAASNIRMYYETVENCVSTSAKLAVIWLGALLLALPELLIHQLVTEEREVLPVVPTVEPVEVPAELLPSERCVIRISTALPDSLYVLGLTYDSARLWWHFGCYFCLPTVFTIVCSVVTAQKMRQAEKTNVRGKREQILFEKRMNCTVVALAILYAFCIIPENVCNVVAAYMAVGMSVHTLDVLHMLSQMMLFCKSAVTPVLLLVLCKTFSKTFLHCCCCCLDECGEPKSPTTNSIDNENEGTTDMELSPYSTVQREESSYTPVATHC